MTRAERSILALLGLTMSMLTLTLVLWSWLLTGCAATPAARPDTTTTLPEVLRLPQPGLP